MHAMPVMVGILCCLAIAYRYYSAFIAAKVATLDDARGTAAMVAILFIIVIALAGLGKVVVNALGGERAAYPADSALVVSGDIRAAGGSRYVIPANTKLVWNGGKSEMTIKEDWTLDAPT